VSTTINGTLILGYGNALLFELV